VEIKRILLITFFSFGVSAESMTLEDCVILLPEGEKYKVEIVLDVDKTTKKSAVTGNFSVTGGSDSSGKFDIRDFVNCASPIIKPFKENSENKQNL